MQSLIENLIEGVMRRCPPEKGDYLCEEDGYIHCGKCHGSKQQHIRIGKNEYIVPIMCSCMTAEINNKKNAEIHAEKLKKSAEIRSRCFGNNGKNANMTFSADRYPDSRESTYCRQYVCEKAFLEQGLLLYGGVGTGKTYYGCCILNELINMGYECKFIHLGDAVQQLFSGKFDLGSIQTPDILMLDDLGTTRETDYATEQIYNIIDSRDRSGKPVIITTNLTPSVIKNAIDLPHRRIYDRILEMCQHRVQVLGKSKRSGL